MKAFFENREQEIIDMEMSLFDEDYAGKIHMKNVVKDAVQKAVRKREKEVVKEQSMENTYNLVKEQVSPEVIARCTGVPLETALPLRQ